MPNKFSKEKECGGLYKGTGLTLLRDGSWFNGVLWRYFNDLLEILHFSYPLYSIRNYEKLFLVDGKLSVPMALFCGGMAGVSFSS